MSVRPPESLNSPSTKLVWTALRQDGPLSHDDLAAQLDISRRTARRATNEIEAKTDCLTTLSDPDDGRRTLYDVTQLPRTPDGGRVDGQSGRPVSGLMHCRTPE